jgi:signal transduction histidine kinase/uncharacterized protein YhfF
MIGAVMSVVSTEAHGDLLHTIARGTAGDVGEEFLRSLVRHLAHALGAEIAFVAELLPGRDDRARVAAAWPADCPLLPEASEFDIVGTPCELAVHRDVVSIPDGTLQAFPGDELIAAHGLDGYLAVAMRGADGARIGHIGVLSTRRLDPTAEDLAALSIFAARAAAEVERRCYEQELRRREIELAASRERVVHAADEERRRIGRNLHDGAQQRLVAIAQRLDLARALIEHDPQAAVRHLETAQESAIDAGGDLRRLARGLYPNGLAKHGLAGALATLAATSPLPVRIEELPDRRLPEGVELALYYMVSEALTNALKYAEARSLSIAVTLDDGGVTATVRDNGRGGATVTDVGGLAGLSDRIGALGGDLAIASPAREGTSLSARIPLSPWRTPRDPFLEYGRPGDDGAGEMLIDAIVSGRKTVTVSLAREWNLEGGPPGIGQVLPVRDQRGVRHCSVVVERVEIVPFDQAAPLAIAGDETAPRTPAEWTLSMQAFYDARRGQIAGLVGVPGWCLDAREPMVLVWFRVLGEQAAC